MNKNDPVDVGRILDELKKNTELGEQFEKARIWDRWNDLAGGHLAAHGQPKAIRDNTLYVEAESPVWMHRFAYYKWDILKRINRMTGRELVSDIFVVLKAEEGEELPENTPEKRRKRHKNQ